jgi:hypothetical protein
MMTRKAHALGMAKSLCHRVWTSNDEQVTPRAI